MRRYKGLKRRRRPLKIRQQVVATQKQFIRGVILLLGITLLIIFVFGDHGLLQLYKMKRERATVQAHIVQLRKEREKVTAEKNRLENDLQYIEKLARERYRMVKPGEKVYKVISRKQRIKNQDEKKLFLHPSFQKYIVILYSLVILQNQILGQHQQHHFPQVHIQPY